MEKIGASELIINSDGSVFHLHMKPQELADTVILVGDPGRVELVSSFFETVEAGNASREFVWATGTYKGCRMTVLSTGIGCDNLDIVMTELDALVNIDFSSMRVKENLRSLRILRIGTSGAIQPDIPVGSFVYRILAGADPNKDQSYFLCQLTQDQLSKALFPIGDIPKPEVRRLAAEADLPSADKKDSQGICFVGKVDLPTFLQQKLKPCEGDVVEVFDAYYSDNEQYKFIHDTLQSLLDDQSGDVKMITDYISDDKVALTLRDGASVQSAGCPWSIAKLEAMSDDDYMRLSQPVDYDIKFETETYRSGRKHIKKTRYKENPYGKIVGRHDGAQFYTIGQRKGLNIGGHKDSIFVIETDIPKNIIYVGEGHTHKGLSRSCLRIDPSEIHWIREDITMKVGEIRRYRVRIRYRQPLQEATLIMRENGLYILFDTPQRGITPGQFAAWYTPLNATSAQAQSSLHPDTCTEMIGSGVI